jgi:hypothetical protein
MHAALPAWPALNHVCSTCWLGTSHIGFRTVLDAPAP